jgi:hypothetical protein
MIEFDTRTPMEGAHPTIRTYKKAIGRNNDVWVYANVPNAGDYIYSRNGDDKGFGGKMLTFELEGGSKVLLRAPYLLSSGALYASTGVDLRDKHMTQGIIARHREEDVPFQTPKYTTVYHHDEKPVIGTYDRIHLLAETMARERWHPVVFAVRGTWGSNESIAFPPQRSNT